MKIMPRLLLTVFCLLTMFAFSNIAAAEGENAKDTVVQAFQKFDKVQSYHMAMTADVSMAAENTNIKAVVNGEMDVFAEPYLCKNDMDIAIVINGMQAHTAMVQYMERSGKRLLSYTNIGGKWQRDSAPAGKSNAQNCEDYIKSIKSAALISEDQDFAVFEIVTDMKYIKDVVRKNMGTVSLKERKLFDALMSGSGDLTYILTIDKSSGNISKVTMDVSDFAASFASQIADYVPMPQVKKEEMIDMINSVKIQMTFTFSKFDDIEPFTIPEEARSEA